MTDLVFELAGYLVQDFDEVVLFIMLEAIDSNRITALVEYFAEYADYLVALLEEDAQHLDSAYERITDI